MINCRRNLNCAFKTLVRMAVLCLGLFSLAFAFSHIEERLPLEQGMGCEVPFLLELAFLFNPQAARPDLLRPPLLAGEDMRYDFNQLRNIIANEHCCLSEYTGKQEFDSFFGERYNLIDRPMRYEEFFKIVAPITARVGCMHTALWMPGRFFNRGVGNLFPLQFKLLEDYLAVTGSFGMPLKYPSEASSWRSMEFLQAKYLKN